MLRVPQGITVSCLLKSMKAVGSYGCQNLTDAGWTSGGSKGGERGLGGACPQTDSKRCLNFLIISKDLNISKKVATPPPPPSQINLPGSATGTGGWSP